MKNRYILLLISSVLFSLCSCDKEDDMREESVVVVETSNQNELDVWIYENLTAPYNVEVKYKWDDSEIDNAYTVVPPKVEKAKEFLEAYLNVWIKTYEAEANAGGDPEFLHKYMPKLLVLVGCPQYNEDGTMLLGLAEGGRKVTIFDIDNFNEPYLTGWETEEEIQLIKKRAVISAFHTLHHEFAHIMHQTKFYPDEFKEICRGDYTGNWYEVYETEARTKGFITPYSMLNENEDFVEIVAGMLTRAAYCNEPKLYTDLQLKDESGVLTAELGDVYLNDWEELLYLWAVEFDWDTYLLYQTPEALVGYDKFEQKIDIVTTYYKEKWHIDLYSLQKRIETAVDELFID